MKSQINTFIIIKLIEIIEIQLLKCYFYLILNVLKIFKNNLSWIVEYIIKNIIIKNKNIIKVMKIRIQIRKD